MNLIKTSLLSAVATTVKIIALLGINKILALHVGVGGYAVIGQFQNLVQIISTVANGAISTGVTKYTAEYYDEPEKRNLIWKAATTIALVSSLLTVLVLVSFKEKLATNFLNDPKYANVFIWLAFSLIALVFNTLLLSVLNGLKQIKPFVIAGILGSILSFIIIGYFSWKYKLYGALVALSIYQGIGLITTIFVCYGTKWFRFSQLFGKYNADAGKKLFSFALMSIVSATAMPLCSIMVRRLLIDRFGIEYAGIWEGMSRVSSAYMLFLTSILAVYYLPRLSEIKNKAIFQFEIKRGLQLLIFIAIFASGTIFLFRSKVILILFSSDFQPMSELFAYQMIGDVVKVCSWLLGYVLLSKAMLRTFVAAEIVFSLTFYGLVYMLADKHNFAGVSLAYLINYCGYFCALVITLPYIFKKMEHEELIK
jgi:PST family polysaccharide transporter